jgi:hypothetical protein
MVDDHEHPRDPAFGEPGQRLQCLTALDLAIADYDGEPPGPAPAAGAEVSTDSQSRSEAERTGGGGNPGQPGPVWMAL